MPSRNSDREPASRRKVNPATSSAEELLAHLGVNPAEGLSPKEAERRRIRSTAAPLFRNPPPRFSEGLARAFREPVLWMLLAVALISLFFDRVMLGLVCVTLAGGHALLCAFLWYRAAQIDAAMQAYDAPLSRVLRGRRIRRMSAEAIVRGDILLLYPGDVLPADCRLLRTDRFSVSERELDATSPERAMIRLEKNADDIPDTTGNFRLSPPNMAFAGALVESGFALAVVVSTGSQTHLGGLVSRISPAHTGRRPRLFKMAARGLSLYNLALVVLIIPIVAIGIFTLGDRYEFLDIFLSAIALASLGFSEHLLIKGTYIAAHIRSQAAEDRDRSVTVDIKSNMDAEKLTSLTDLFLVGTAALHDGIPHPVTLQIGANTYHCDRPDADENALTVAELLYIHGMASTRLPAAHHNGAPEDIATLISSISEWADVDFEAVRLRTKDVFPENGGVGATLPCPEGNCRLIIRIFSDPRLLPPLSESEESRLQRDRKAALQSGLRVLFLTTETPTGDEGCVRAMLTYAPRVCPKIPGDIRNMEAAGIRVAAFLPDPADGNLSLLAACGLVDAETTPDSLYDLSCPAADALNEGRRAFVGCNDSYIMDAIRTLRKEGRVVAVLSVDDRDLPLLNAADIAMTTSPSLYATAEDHIAEIPEASPEAPAVMQADGYPYSIIASDLCRRRADVVVRRADASGGGICGVRRALLAADRIKDTLDGVVAYLILAQCARLVLTILSICYGMTAPAAPALLIAGLLVDTVVILAMSRFRIASIPAPRRALSEGLTAPWKTHAARLIAVAIAAVLPVLVVQIAHFADVSLGDAAVHYGTLCLLGLQFAVYTAGFGFNRASHHRTESTPFFVGLVLALFYVAALAFSLGAGLAPLWALVFPLIPALVYFLVARILHHLHR